VLAFSFMLGASELGMLVLRQVSRLPIKANARSTASSMGRFEEHRLK
jgi:hypothetical protein